MSWKINLKGETRSEIAKKHNFGKWMKGRKFTDAARKNFSDSAKLNGKGLWMVGKKHSLKTRLKMSKSQKGVIPNWSQEGRERWLKARKGIRCSRQTEFKMGLQHPYWNYGSSFEVYPMDFNEIFKESIKIRDNFSCVVCGDNKRLTIHHIDYNKLNTCKENCICVCGSCHSKTNFNRNQWQRFFQSLLGEKYNYCIPLLGVIKND